MIEISKEEIYNLFEQWNYIKNFETLEKNLGRELTDDELKKIIFYIIGYYDVNSNKTLGNFIANIGLTDSLNDKDYERIKNIEI